MLRRTVSLDDWLSSNWPPALVLDPLANDPYAWAALHGFGFDPEQPPMVAGPGAGLVPWNRSIPWNQPVSKQEFFRAWYANRGDNPVLDSTGTMVAFDDHTGDFDFGNVIIAAAAAWIGAGALALEAPAAGALEVGESVSGSYAASAAELNAGAGSVLTADMVSPVVDLGSATAGIAPGAETITVIDQAAVDAALAAPSLAPPLLNPLTTPSPPSVPLPTPGLPTPPGALDALLNGLLKVLPAGAAVALSSLFRAPQSAASRAAPARRAAGQGAGTGSLLLLAGLAYLVLR